MLCPKSVLKMNNDNSKDLPESSCDGIVLTVLDGKIACDNTVSAGLDLICEELLPSTRAILFPE